MQARDGRWLEGAGLVLVRQMPGSAKGVMFITIEDESGIANLVVWPRIFETQRRIILAAGMLAVYGPIQREGDVVHLVAHRLKALGKHRAPPGAPAPAPRPPPPADHPQRPPPGPGVRAKLAARVPLLPPTRALAARITGTQEYPGRGNSWDWRTSWMPRPARAEAVDSFSALAGGRRPSDRKTRR
jgi:hypothetical protein